VFDGFTAKKLEYVPPDPAYIACNPSVHFDGVTWRCIVRCINYRLGGHIPEEPNTQNVMLVLDNDMGVIRAHPIADRTGQARSGYPISGFEDCRLFQWKGNLWASATTCHLTIEGKREIVLLELDSEYAFVACYPLRGPWSHYFQKNWIPCPMGDTLRMLYSVDRSLVIGVNAACEVGSYVMDNGNVRHASDVIWRAVGNHRGSSHAIRTQGSWLVLVHGEGYQSRFMRLDGDTYRPTHQTEMFNFRVVNEVEFAAGMALGKQELVVSYSVRDATVELGTFPLESVMSKMERISS
jgi:hypothetical protein